MPFPLLLALSLAPVSIASETRDLDFEYNWSAEAEAVPALSRRFRADAVRQRQAMNRMAVAEKKARREMGTSDWNGLQFSRSVETAGQSGKLLSLVTSTSSYTGGAHPNGRTSALLWDRKLSRETNYSALLLAGQRWDGALRLPFCVLLDRERAKRRGETVVNGEWPSQCPEMKELTIALADHDRNGRFDHADLTADSYVAGPYAEGPYEISLPITATMVQRLKPEFRASFEAQPPVQ
ncbi:PdaC/SigV domain-containing protein [Sphingomonas humi]|uniref:Deacetylase PdaC domain-containing protein n=1 Tax=Sphingomonas humi TaxID=335630 RepID=A0ABP7S850_9SPHN